MTTPALASAAVLTEQYRQAQVELSARTIAAAVAAWRLLAEDPQRNQPTWLAYMLELVRRDRAQSAKYARDYLGTYRRMVGVTTPFTPMIEPMNVEQVVTSLQVTGPVALERKVRQLREQRAPDDVEEPRINPASEMARVLQEGVARAAQRHVANGGRQVIENAIEADPQARGYVRVTDGDPCFFCAVLASRGAVYTDDSFDDSDPRFEGPGNHKVHDGCGCTLVPVYDRNPANPLLDRSRELYSLWQSTGQKFSGKRALLEFRRAYENRGDYRV